MLNSHFITAFICVLLILAFTKNPVSASDHKSAAAVDDGNKFLVIIFDGLRPDYITPELMPNLYDLGQTGVIAKNHHVVFPSVTRVNSPSIGAGAYPGTHGMMHNHILLPEISDEVVSTGGANNLLQLEPIVTSPTLGEILEEHGKTVFVSSSGSSGTSLLLNPTGAGAGVWNARGFILPQEKRDFARETIGEFPEREQPNYGQNRWAVDAFLKLGLDRYDADVSLMWINDPDGTAHTYGIGAEETNTALRHADEELGRILEGLKERGLGDKTNIIISSDHGFSTRTGPFRISDILEESNLSEDTIQIIGNAHILIQDDNKEKKKKVVQALQKSPYVGAVFTKPETPGSSEGVVKGTLSMDLISYNHPRAADILVGASWNHDKNEYGYRGTSSQRGVAGHGTTSPYEMQINMIAFGPDFKNGVISNVPTGNIDIAPTVLNMLGLPAAEEMEGRAIKEITVEGPAPDSVEFYLDRYESSGVEWNPFYRMILYKARVGDTEYLREARIVRE
jgi:arylsulfatase A-like enzyme